MQDVETQEDTAEAPSEGFFSTFGRVLGALGSLLLLVGILVWSWQLYSRDVSEIPVIRAELEPMRIAPEDIGGTEVPHQGLSVNRVIEGQGVAEPQSDVALAPAPETLPQEDVLVTLPGPSAIQTQTDQPLGEEAVVLSESVVSEAESPEAESETADLSQDTNSPPSSPTPLPPQPVAGSSLVAPEWGLPPLARPENLQRIDLTRAGSAGRPLNPVIALADVPSGIAVIQLGAFDTSEIAAEQGVLIAQEHKDILAAQQRYIQPIRSGERQFYRLRMMGFADLAEAAAACSALQSRRQDCIPTVQQ